MMMAALEGGLTFQKGLGAVHALSHPLGGLKQVSLHHGTLNAVLLPYVLEFNESHAEAKYTTIRQRLGLNDEDDLANYFRRLNAQLGLRRVSGLSEVDQFVGTGLEEINNDTARLTFPIVVGVRIRFP